MKMSPAEDGYVKELKPFHVQSGKHRITVIAASQTEAIRKYMKRVERVGGLRELGFARANTENYQKSNRIHEDEEWSERNSTNKSQV
jgi:hypothetical protein